MKQILCFGDSNTWGYDGESRKRLPWGVRWTSLLQEKLNQGDYPLLKDHRPELNIRFFFFPDFPKVWDSILLHTT